MFWYLGSFLSLLLGARRRPRRGNPTVNAFMSLVMILCGVGLALYQGGHLSSYSQQASAYDQAVAAAASSKAGNANPEIQEIPALIDGAHYNNDDRSSGLHLHLALADGSGITTLLQGRRNGYYLYQDEKVIAQIWQGKVTLLRADGWEAQTWNNPHRRLTDSKVLLLMGGFMFLFGVGNLFYSVVWMRRG